MSTNDHETRAVFEAASQLLQNLETTADLYQKQMHYALMHAHLADTDFSVHTPMHPKSDYSRYIIITLHKKQPALPDISGPMSPRERLLSLAARSRNTRADIAQSWALVEFSANGEVVISSGKQGDSYLDQSGAVRVGAGMYAAPAETVAKTLLLLAQTDKTEGRILSAAISKTLHAAQNALKQ